MSEEKIVFQCNHIGVAGITDVHVRHVDGKYKARVGIAIMGSSNMSEDELKAIDKDIKTVVSQAADFADSSPEPAPAELYTDVLVEEY